MIDLEYGIGIETDLSLDEAERAIRSALADEGFGILTEIDVAATLKEKLDVDRPAYRILGACSPPLANRALGIDEHIGLLLPCNVIVYESGSGVNVEAMDPGIMTRVAAAPELVDLTAEVRERLVRALQSVEAT